MPLSSGTLLGAYEIVSSIGAGGMGEVYRARDTRLHRDVALKVLGDGVAAHPDRLARFEQEARATAALNHPNIVAVFDIGTHEGRPFLVSELLEGRSLREVLSDGPLPLRKAIDYSIQVATGLAAAHEKGIVHRDLKPDNVFITTEDRAKILDFGIAKLVAADDSIAQANTALVTVAAPRTDAGMVLGTTGYMSPEQIRGATVDARTDIFALGAMLFEMTTGTRPFSGATQADTMSAVLTRDPNEMVLPDGHTPAGIDRIVRRCLEKSPAQRFQSARDLAFALEAVTLGTTRTGPAAAAPTITTRRRFVTRELVAWTLAIGALAVAALLFWRQRATPPVDVPVSRFSFAFPADEVGTTTPVSVISPDGRYILVQSSTLRIYLRRLDDDMVVPVAGSEGGRNPFWSPDSRTFAFRTGSELKRVDLSTNQPVVVATLPADSLGLSAGGAWGANNTALLATVNTPLFRVAMDSGAAAPLRPLNAAEGETSHSSPVFLPDGERFFYQSVRPGQTLTMLASISSDAVAPLSNFDGRIVWANDNLIVYRRGSRLLAQRIRYAPLGVEGEPTQLAGDLEPASALAGGASASNNGVLTYRAASNIDQQFVWFDRSGKRLNTAGPPGVYPTFDLSPDGSRIVASRRDGVQNLWVYETTREGGTRVTFEPGANHVDPRFGPDGRAVIFGNARTPQRLPYRTTVAGDPPTAVPVSFKGRLFALDDWSPDGKWMIFHDAAVATILAARLDQPNHEPITVARAFTGIVDQATMSADGKWVSYNSDESGRTEVYVVPFPPTGDKWQVSTNGGVQPTWRGDGSELYYLGPDAAIVSERIRPAATFQTDRPTALFKTPIGAVNQSVEQYLPAADGSRFLIVENQGAPTRKVTVITNWMALLR